nr:protein QUIRKY [Tanacetum cinerariifolium]
MTPEQQQQPPPPTRPVRKLVIDVVEARDLLPKDGLGSSSAYVVADFDGQKKRTSTISRSLNPVWNESLEFVISDPNTMEYEELEIEVFNDKRMSNGSTRKNHFLGRVKIYGSQFARKGDEGLIYFQLEKKSVFSWIRGEIGLRIYYYDDVEIVDQEPHPENPQQPPSEKEQPQQPPQHMQPQQEGPPPTEHMTDNLHQPQMMSEEPPPQHPPPMTVQMEHHHPNYQNHQGSPPPPPSDYPPDIRRMQTGRVRV